MTAQARIVDISRYAPSCRNCVQGELCLPHGLDEEEMEALQSLIVSRRRLQRGEHIYHMGTPLKALYAVKAGSVKVYTLDANGDEQILGFHLPGDLLGLDGLGSEEHPCAAAALEPAAVCELPIARLSQMYRLIPKARPQLRRMMGKQFAHVHEMILLLGKKCAEARLATFLLRLAERLQERGFSGRALHLSMSRYEIANYLGLAVETVSRLFSRFQEDGLVSVHGREVSFQDAERLREVADHGLGKSVSPASRRTEPTAGGRVYTLRSYGREGDGPRPDPTPMPDSCR